MGEMRGGGSVAWTVGIALAALLALYVEAYYAMVKPTVLIRGSRVDVIAEYHAPIASTRAWCEQIFTPIHRLDRIIREPVWKPIW